MNIGQSIITLPTVKPRTYAGKVGTVATVNDGEVGVLVNGRVVWFLAREIVTVDGNGHLPAPAATTDKLPTSRRQALPSTQERAREGREEDTARGGGQPGSPETPTAIDSRGEEGREGRSPPEPVSRPSSPAESLTGFKPGERGPGGGVVASCLACGELWERPKQRGRPSLNCPRCR